MSGNHGLNRPYKVKHALLFADIFSSYRTSPKKNGLTASKSIWLKRKILKMKIGTKLALGFSFIVIAMLGTVLFCLHTNNKVNKEFEVMTDDVVPAVVGIIRMKRTCHKIAHNLMDYILTGDEKKEKEVRSGLKALDLAVAEQLKHKKIICPKEQEFARQVIADKNRFNSVCTEIINMKKQGFSASELLERENTSFHPAMDTLLVKLRKCTAQHMLQLIEVQGTVYQTHTMGELVAIGVSFTVIFLSAMLALVTTRSIVRPLHALHKGTEIIGGGDLDYKVATKAKDEIGQLSRAFDEMTKKWKNSINSICCLNASNQQLEDEIAKRKRTEEALATSNSELKDFVYVASHDLREPLRKISSFGQLLRKSLEGKLTDDERENLEFMIDGSDRMTMMIDGLLKYSRVNTKDIIIETVDLNNVVEHLKELELGMLLEETGAAIEVPQLLPKVYADPVQIEQLLQNLIANGIKYRKEDTKPVITIKAKENPDKKVRIEVQDNGIGIAPEYRDEIFKMFKRLHARKKYDGCGIGLSVCKKIVDRHAGDIGVETEQGKGSTFWFTIPRAKDAAPADKAATVS